MGRGPGLLRPGHAPSDRRRLPQERAQPPGRCCPLTGNEAFEDGRTGLMRERCAWWWRGAAMVAALVMLAGCAALPSANGVPISDIDLIAGRWAGTITPGSEDDRFYLTISPDHKLVASWGVNTAWGTVTLDSGRATFEMKPPILEGSIRLYTDGGSRTLVLDDLWATFRAQVTPQS